MSEQNGQAAAQATSLAGLVEQWWQHTPLADDRALVDAVEVLVRVTEALAAELQPHSLLARTSPERDGQGVLLERLERSVRALEPLLWGLRERLEWQGRPSQEAEREPLRAARYAALELADKLADARREIARHW